MNTHPFSVRATLMVSALALALPCFLHAETNTWDFSTGKAGSDGKIRFEGSGGRVIRLDDPAVTVGDDAEAPGGKCLVFSGTQTTSVVKGKIQEEGGSFLIKMKVKPQPNSGDADQTIFAHPGVFELRFSPKGNHVSLYLAQPKDSKTMVFARAPLPAGKWSDLEASVKGNEIRLTVGDATDSKTFPEGASLATARSYYQFGLLFDRTFKGSVASLTLSEPAE